MEEMENKEFSLSVMTLQNRQPATIWLNESWQVEGVVREASAEAAQSRELVYTDGVLSRYRHRGLRMRLHRDEAESYYWNLMAAQPQLFVICRERDAEPEPFLVTASHDEAGAYMESDEVVFSVPMPPEIYRAVEAFVIEHYVPTPRKKRKRL